MQKTKLYEKKLSLALIKFVWSEKKSPRATAEPLLDYRVIELCFSERNRWRLVEWVNRAKKIE